MRLWSLHPSYLDRQGLIALWREGLLAQQVLQGKTRGYTNHPQLLRFRQCADPLGAMAAYLREVVVEAKSRGYRFDAKKIVPDRFKGKIRITSGQADYEFAHLLKKLKIRDRMRFSRLKGLRQPIRLHPLFKAVDGGIETWEKVE